MKESKDRTIRINRFFVRSGFGGQPPWPPDFPPRQLPEEFLRPEVWETPDFDIGLIPLGFPGLQVGDKVDRDGFIELLRIDELGYSPDVPPGASALANRVLEHQTYCLVQLSDQNTAASNLEEFRILYAELSGEKLATSMAVVAALKGAFLGRKKVRVHAELSQLEVAVPPLPRQKSQLYNALRSVDLMRT